MHFWMKIFANSIFADFAPLFSSEKYSISQKPNLSQGAFGQFVQMRKLSVAFDLLRPYYIFWCKYDIWIWTFLTTYTKKRHFPLQSHRFPFGARCICSKVQKHRASATAEAQIILFGYIRLLQWVFRTRSQYAGVYLKYSIIDAPKPIRLISVKTMPIYHNNIEPHNNIKPIKQNFTKEEIYLRTHFTHFSTVTLSYRCIPP